MPITYNTYVQDRVRSRSNFNAQSAATHGQAQVGHDDEEGAEARRGVAPREKARRQAHAWTVECLAQSKPGFGRTEGEGECPPPDRPGSSVGTSGGTDWEKAGRSVRET